MYLPASKELDMPVHTHRLIDASAFPSVFTSYVVLVRCVLYVLFCLTKLLNKGLSGYLTNDKLSKMDKEFEATDSYSEKINEDLAKTISSGMKATFSASASRDLMNKYLKPENYDWIRTPLLNPELWNSDCLSDDFKNNEKFFINNEQMSR